MDMIEAILWVGVGFGVTYAGLEIAWRTSKRNMPALAK